MRKLILSALVATIGLPAVADDAAVVIANERYRHLDRLVGGAEAVDHLRQARGSGYAATALRDGSIADQRDALTAFEAESGDATRLVAVLSGRFVTDGNRTWLLSASATEPTLFGLEREAISVESVMKVLAATPSRAVLLLGFDNDADQDFGSALREGIGRLDIPQGVTVLRGRPNAIADLLSDHLLVDGADIIGPARGDRNIRVAGFAPRSLVMQPATTGQNTLGLAEQVREQLLWEQVEQSDTLSAYESYLDAFPQGPNAGAAAAAIAEFKAEPNRADRVIEDRLNLGRGERQEIQRDLSLLGYNTRGVDGIFGRGTRTAISNWQQENGFRQTGYLRDEQIVRINAQAARRAAQQQAEAEREQAAQDRRDRAFWEETGISGQEADLRAYLDRFPNGLYSSAANNLLEQIAEENQQAAARADRTAWDRALNVNSAVSYQAYLDRFPSGAFRDEAQARLNALQQPAQSEDEAREAERALQLNRATRLLAERKLAQLGFDPGPVDGRFTRKTRRAIREFQQARGAAETGFLNRQTSVLLLVAQ